MARWDQTFDGWQASATQCTIRYVHTGRTSNSTGIVECIECRRVNAFLWHGWKAYRVDDPDTEARLPELGFYCPGCAEREFGVRTPKAARRSAPLGALLVRE